MSKWTIFDKKKKKGDNRVPSAKANLGFSGCPTEFAFEFPGGARGWGEAPPEGDAGLQSARVPLAVYRHTLDPGIRPILDDVCQEKARHLGNANRDVISTTQSELLHTYFVNRERELSDLLDAIRQTKEALATPS